MSNTQTATVTTTNTAVITGKTAPRIYFPAIIFGTLGALIGLFTAGAAMIELVLIAKYGLPNAHDEMGFETFFPRCGQDVANICVQPVINAKFALCATAAVTFILGVTTFLLPFRGRSRWLTIIDPLFANGPFLLFLILGFLVLGMSGVVGFSAGLSCFGMAFIYFVFMFVERDTIIVE